jgi:hypothetical protein
MNGNQLLLQDLSLHHLKKINLWDKYFFLFGFFWLGWKRLENGWKRLETSLGCWVHVRKRIPDDEHTRYDILIVQMNPSLP